MLNLVFNVGATAFLSSEALFASRYLPVYIGEMESLWAADPETYATMSVPGNWTATRSDRKFASTAMDQTIEQTVNGQSKAAGGISGRTLNPGKKTVPVELEQNRHHK